MPMWVPSRTAETICCVFDLAGTLFRSSEFDRTALHNVVRCVAVTLKIDEGEAETRLNTRRDELSSRAGFRVALSAAGASFGVDADTWDHYQMDVDLNTTLRADAEIAVMMSHLHECCHLVLYTNICRPLMTRVLEHLDLATVWNQTITPREAGSPKPSPAFAQLLLSTIGIPAERVLAVGDRPDIDLLPFTNLGTGGYLIADRNDLLSLLTDLRTARSRSAEMGFRPAREQGNALP